MAKHKRLHPTPTDEGDTATTEIEGEELDHEGAETENPPGERGESENPDGTAPTVIVREPAPKRDPGVPLGGNVPGETEDERKFRAAQITNTPIPKTFLKGVSAPIPPGAQGSYHANPDAGQSAGERLPVNTAPYLDEDTHDFGPDGNEDRCRRCGLSRMEIAEKIGRPLTVEELEHPDVKDGPLLPPRIR